MSGRFDGGVSWYDSASTLLTVSFPEGDRKCRWCPMCRRDSDIRYRCQLNNRILYTVEAIPPECPLQFNESEETKHESI